MKVKSGFMLREIAKQWVVVPLGERTVEFNAIMTLSETGALLWKLLQQDVSKSDLVNGLIEVYEIDSNTANQDVDGFIQQLETKGLVER